MLSVAVHKDIAEYQPKIVGKMTMRTLVSDVYKRQGVQSVCNQNYRLSKQKTRYQLGYVTIGNEFFINKDVYKRQSLPSARL